MISPKICHCIHPFFREYAPVSTPSSYCIRYSVIKRYSVIVLYKMHIVHWQNFYTAAGSDGIDKFHLWMRPFWITTSFVQAWRESFHPILNKKVSFLPGNFVLKLQTWAKTMFLSQIRKKIHYAERTNWRHFWARQKCANFCHSESFQTVVNQQEIASLPSSDVSELF